MMTIPAHSHSDGKTKPSTPSKDQEIYKDRNIYNIEIYKDRPDGVCL